MLEKESLDAQHLSVSPMNQTAEREKSTPETTKPLIMLELNEINFRWIEQYIEKGHLPEFRRIFDEYEVFETASEAEYENCEPWIQWLSAHSGKTFDEHGVFRLGDAVGSQVDQVWRVLEDNGVTVGAVSPMNAENDLEDPAYFIPDPWTNTSVSGSYTSKVLYDSLKKAVNANAGGRVGLRSYAGLALGAMRFARPKNWGSYLNLSVGSVGRPWRKAIFLDRLLADVFVTLQKAKRPQFSTLFLNAGAHIQHHYLYNSAVYDGEHRNPEWYIKAEDDPVLEVYRCYDQILGDIRRHFPDTRLLLFTALHQDPYPELIHYWRLQEHRTFLSAAGLADFTVDPRMSRDFLLKMSSPEATLQAERVLNEARIVGSDIPVFEVDNRGESLFVTLVWPDDVTDDLALKINGRDIANFRKSLAFVAIKNGHHNPIGYGLDTGDAPEPAGFPIQRVYHKILEHFQVPVPAEG